MVSYFCAGFSLYFSKNYYIYFSLSSSNLHFVISNIFVKANNVSKVGISKGFNLIYVLFSITK